MLLLTTTNLKYPSKLIHIPSHYDSSTDLLFSLVNVATNIERNIAQKEMTDSSVKQKKIF